MMEQALENKIYNAAAALWDLQENNYDIEHNYQELLDFDFFDPRIAEQLDTVIARCKQIRRDEKPPADPKVSQIFRDNIAPIPNNSVINVVARAIMAGGDCFASKAGGWQLQGGNLCFEVGFENAGAVIVTIDDCLDQSAFVQSLSVSTLDVLVCAISHLSHEFSRQPTSTPLALKTNVTAKQLLNYKAFKSYGRKRWDALEKIDEEFIKLEKIRIGVKNAGTRKGNKDYQSHLMTIKPLKRDFNGHTKNYIPTSWQIQPGTWAMYNMSKGAYKFIGKLNQSVFKYDHRQQRGAQLFAKKLMYALFVIPGGTHYLKRGAKKSLGEYLELIGEYHESDDNGNIRHRNLKRLGKALDFLVGEQMIKISMEGSVSEYIDSHSGPWQLQKIHDTIVKIEMVEANRPALLDANTCPT